MATNSFGFSYTPPAIGPGSDTYSGTPAPSSGSGSTLGYLAGFPTGLPGPSAPQQPGAAGPNAQAAAFKSWYQASPEWLQAAPGFASQQNALYAHYGWHPTSHGYAEDTSQQNPYSVTSLLARALEGNVQQDENTANAHGVLFSGANANAVQHSADRYNQGLSAAQQAFQEALQGVNAQQTSLLEKLFPEYAAQAGHLGGQVAAAHAAAGSHAAGTPGAPGVPTPPSVAHPGTPVQQEQSLAALGQHASTPGGAEQWIGQAQTFEHANPTLDQAARRQLDAIISLLQAKYLTNDRRDQR